MERCKICNRVKEFEDFCKYHSLAYKNLLASYERWKEAYGDLSWSDYLKKLMENENTGIWVKEVINFLKWQKV